MYPAERHAAILDAARRQGGEVTVQQLGELLEVAPETVRRDLGALERRGLLRRRHGGAVLAERAPFESPLSLRGLAEAEERRAVAEAVAELLPAEGSILLDSGTMTLEVARSLAARRDTGALLVVTTSLPIAMLLTRHPRLTALLLPGRLRAVTQAVVGAATEQRLAELQVDAAVLGANGVTPGRGAFTTLPDEASVKERMLDAAGHRILAVLASKFDSPSLSRFATLDRFDTVVTDARLDAETAGRVADDGPELILAGEHPGDRSTTPPKGTPA
ncbi:DeoR/GlpR family DNA-binding transcription regulator [Herbiconiux sp. KACC 21604]|uniref:DeoR/GlpR family DNA-binding transcription regulator n=1 Tax=unclassified Herbiconiux TaxID=2618217 RepID=UPI001492DD5F|nr:DeoR/GlpR family DNA-binding transcription regulator [Herbiconiux sp. SALV-R1]QJU53117.1 DeoR/GlpR transcriptional regulator [Herbiconiux sp. SALV-R1]WPO88058.1 DeoR/GlpR family DNA-binding transcription regulator [Herbiconiux sp. KACC 21604]